MTINNVLTIISAMPILRPLEKSSVIIHEKEAVVSVPVICQVMGKLRF